MYLHEIDLTKKIRLSDWIKDDYIIGIPNTFIDNYGTPSNIRPDQIKSNNWEYYKEELKIEHNCPFCGNKVYVDNEDHNNEIKYGIRCNDIKCYLADISCEYDSKNEAIKVWEDSFKKEQ